MNYGQFYYTEGFRNYNSVLNEWHPVYVGNNCNIPIFVSQMQPWVQNYSYNNSLNNVGNLSQNFDQLNYGSQSYYFGVYNSNDLYYSNFVESNSTITSSNRPTNNFKIKHKKPDVLTGHVDVYDSTKKLLDDSRMVIEDFQGIKDSICEKNCEREAINILRKSYKEISSKDRNFKEGNLKLYLSVMHDLVEKNLFGLKVDEGIKCFEYLKSSLRNSEFIKNFSEYGKDFVMKQFERFSEEIEKQSLGILYTPRGVDNSFYDVYGPMSCYGVVQLVFGKNRTLSDAADQITKPRSTPVVLPTSPVRTSNPLCQFNS